MPDPGLERGARRLDLRPAALARYQRNRHPMVRDDRVEDADSSNGANQQQLRTDVQDCTLLSLKGFDVVGDRNPTLCTLHPGEVAWPEPSCRFDGKHVRYGLQNMIDPDSALGTEHTRNLTMTKSPAFT